MASTHVLRNALRILPSKQSSCYGLQITRQSSRRCKNTLSTTSSQKHNVNQKNCTKAKKLLISSIESVKPISSSAITLSDVDVKTQIDDEDGDFDSFGISEETQNALRANGITKLFPVQTKAYKYVELGKDVIVKARTGTGKTLAFALPLVENLLERHKKRGDAPKAIVLTPTRELANQVEEHTRRLNRKIRIVCVYGGAKYHPQENAILQGLDIVVGTPGRLKDMIERGVLDLSEIEHVVLDEVDRMLDMGFQDIVDEILGNCYREASKPQTLLFSATVPPFVRKAARKYLSPDVLLIDLVGEDNVQAATTVKQLAVECNFVTRKVLESLISTYNSDDGKTIIFCNTKRECDEIGRYLPRGRALHGDLSQQQRNYAIEGFKSGSIDVLVTTDVAARGLDIPDVELVIQTGPPNDPDNFIHRTGRTGRAGKTGTAILIYKQQDYSSLTTCERVAQTKFTQIDLPEQNIEEDINKTISKIERVNLSGAVNLMGEKAKQLQEKMGAMESLSAALVLLTKTKDMLDTSLLTRTKQYRTFQFETTEGRLTKDSVEALLEEVLEDKAGDVLGLTLSADGSIAVFDVPFYLVQTLENKMSETNQDGVLSQLMVKLPEGIERLSFGLRTFDHDRISNYSGRPRFGSNRHPNDRFRSNFDRKQGFRDFNRSRFDELDSFSRSGEFERNRGFERRKFERRRDFDRNGFLDGNRDFESRRSNFTHKSRQSGFDSEDVDSDSEEPMYRRRSHQRGFQNRDDSFENRNRTRRHSSLNRKFDIQKQFFGEEDD